MHNFEGKTQNFKCLLYLALDVSYLLLSRCGVLDVQGMDKILETAVKYTHFFINMELGHRLHVIGLGIDSRKFRLVLVEYCTTFMKNV